MFWTGKFLTYREVTVADLSASALGIGFGAIHWIAWSSDFTSYTELILWRASCIYMVAFFALASANYAVVAVGGKALLDNMKWRYFANKSLYLLVAVAFPYTFSRIATVTIALMSLRSLPPAAYEVVDWTSFIPHL